MTGFFGYITNGTVKNVFFENIDLKAGHFTGGIVGAMNGGTIKNCAITGSIQSDSAHRFVGGIVGKLYAEPIANYNFITDCYIQADVMGECAVGGVVGQAFQNTLIDRCIFSGSATAVKGANPWPVAMGAGGIAGLTGEDPWTHNHPNADIGSCVVVGAKIIKPSTATTDDYNRIIGTYYPGTLTNNYAGEDVVLEGVTHEINSEASSSDGLTKTISDLKTVSTYETLGYQFGTDEYAPWNINSNEYPKLWFMLPTTSTVSKGLIDISKFHAYYDKNQNAIVIKSKENLEISGVNLFSVTGTLIKNWDITIRQDSHQLPISNLESGVYLIGIHENNNTALLKVLVGSK